MIRFDSGIFEINCDGTNSHGFCSEYESFENDDYGICLKQSKQAGWKVIHDTEEGLVTLCINCRID